MKASRAPGPVQSYAILHNQKSTHQVVGPGKKGKSTSSLEANQGIARKYIDLDDIPDFPSGGVEWGKIPGKAVATAPAASTQQHGLFGNAHQAAGPAFNPHHGIQPKLAPHISPRGANEDVSDEEYEDLGYGQAHSYQNPHAISMSVAKTHSSPPFKASPAKAQKQHMDIHTEYDDDPMIDDGDNVQTYSSPRKPDGKKAVSTIKSAPKPPAAVVSMQKQPVLSISANGPRSTTPSNQVKRTPKTVPPQKKGDSPKYQPPPNNAKPPPPLPCEQPMHYDDDGSPSTISGGSPKHQLYFSKQPRPVEFKPYTLKQYSLIKPKEYVEIANIQPDLNSEELVAKRKNIDRIKEFSKQLRKVNQDQISQQKKLPAATEQEDLLKARQKYNSARQRALDFSKHIPKPAGGGQRDKDSGEFDMDDEEYDLQDTRVSLSAGNAPNKSLRRPKKTQKDESLQQKYRNEDDEAAARLLELEAKHQQGKAQVEAIKKALAGTSIVK